MCTSDFQRVLVKFTPIISSGKHARITLSKLTEYITSTPANNLVRICATRGLIYFDNILEFTFPAIGINIVVMAVEGVVLFILTLLLELNFFVHKFGLLCMGRDVRPAKINPEDVSSRVTESTFYLLSLLIPLGFRCG